MGFLVFNILLQGHQLRLPHGKNPMPPLPAKIRIPGVLFPSQWLDAVFNSLTRSLCVTVRGKVRARCT